eukprot:753523-Hanusia_phi.AAC.3
MSDMNEFVFHLWSCHDLPTVMRYFKMSPQFTEGFSRSEAEDSANVVCWAGVVNATGVRPHSDVLHVWWAGIWGPLPVRHRSEQ